MKQKEIIRKIVKGLSSNINPNYVTDWENWKTSDWTRNVLNELCAVGKKFGCRVWTTGNPRGADGGEWLYDQTWTYPDSDNWTKNGWSIPMIAECEWANDLGYIQEDFEKLLQARADVRVMIIDAAQWNDGSTSELIADKLCEWVRLFRGSTKGDVYLLAAYEEKTKPWNWRFFVIRSNGFKKKVRLKQVNR